MSVLHELGAGVLRRLEAETAHEITVKALAWGLGPRATGGDDPILATRVAGLNLANPIGLAAGFDKDARAARGLLRAGFGFIECGTVTPLAQAGNPRPRLFRLTADGAVINRMGFNNQGLDAFAHRLASLQDRTAPVGANLGANKQATDRTADYVLGLRRLWGLCDYVTLNVSSPNTPGLRELQHDQALEDLLAAVAEARDDLIARRGGRVPILIKIAPDLTEAAAAAIAGQAVSHGVDGLIVSNTTLARPATLTDRWRAEAGGLSGAPLFEISTRLLRTLWPVTRGRLALIGVGGVASGAEAYAKIRAGADAVQLYTALAYQGPGLVGRIKVELAALLRADGFGALRDAVGAG